MDIAVIDDEDDITNMSPGRKRDARAPAVFFRQLPACVRDSDQGRPGNVRIYATEDIREDSSPSAASASADTAQIQCSTRSGTVVTALGPALKQRPAAEGWGRADAFSTIESV